MTDDEVFFAAVCKQFGHRVPVKEREAPDVKVFVSAAVITKPMLVLATVEHPALDRCRLDENRSRRFELIDRSARSMKGLVEAMTRFIHGWQIGEVFLRSHSERGKYPGHPVNFKIEAALQMVPGLTVTFVNTHSIAAWVRRQDPVIPPGEPDLGAALTAKQRLAIETALFVSRNYTNPKLFSDGSADDD